MALAQGLAADPRYAGLVVLADLALDADQAVLHDAGDVVPGLQELVDAHRAGVPTHRRGAGRSPGRPSTAATRCCSACAGIATGRPSVPEPSRPPSTGCGGRTASSSPTSSPTSRARTSAASSDVEDRNVLARTATARAQAVVVVGLPGAKGVHSLVRVARRRCSSTASIPAASCSSSTGRRATRRARAEITRAVAELTGGLRGGGRDPVAGLPARTPEVRRSPPRQRPPPGVDVRPRLERRRVTARALPWHEPRGGGADRGRTRRRPPRLARRVGGRRQRGRLNRRRPFRRPERGRRAGRGSPGPAGERSAAPPSPAPGRRHWG